MALNIGDNFSYLGAKPLDTRRVFANKAAMDAVNLSTVYEGMIAYAKAEDKYYRLKGGTWIEFKTGSDIGIWKTNTSYSIGDIVLNDNKIYRCIAAHTSTSFNSDFANWDDINAYLSLWHSNTPYRVGNVVVASGKIYQCKTTHVSGASFSDTNWSEIGGGGRLESWTTNTDYKVGDIVKYDTTLYKCTIAHTSSDFATERVNWEIFGQDKIKVEDWQTGVYYENKQLVLYSNNVYRCNTSHTSDSSFDLDGAKWDIVYTSVNSWIGNAYYKVGTTVVRQGTLYRCSTDHVSESTFDATEAAKWVVIGDSVPVITKWATNTDYDENDVVVRDGVIYQCMADHKSTTFEADKDNWQANNITYIWQDNTLYFAGQIVINDGIAYMVDITFISGATFSDTNLTPIKILLSQDSKNVLQYKNDGLFGDDPEGLTSAEIINLINNFNPSGGGIMSIEDWEANHGYLVKNVVFYNNAVYRCKTAHTSGTTFDTTKWTNVTGGSGTSIDDWKTATAYGVGDWVRYDNVLYRCNTAHTSFTFVADKAKWSAITAEEMVGATDTDDGEAGIVPQPKKGEENKFLKADGTWDKEIKDWASGTEYKIGDIVLFSGMLHKCTTANSDTTFDSSKWFQIGSASSVNVTEKVLWSSTFGSVSQGQTITLADSVMNYDEIVIKSDGQNRGMLNPAQGLNIGSSNDGGSLGTTFSHEIIFTFSGASATLLIWQYGSGLTNAGIQVVGRKYGHPAYSTTEQRVGTWIDGKPIYQKTYVTNTPSAINAQQAIVADSSVSADTVVDYTGYIKLDLTSLYQVILFLELNHVSDDLTVFTGCSILTTTRELGIYQTLKTSNSSYCNLPCIITIKYTKTTD